MNFAPYQDGSPELNRALSPPPQLPRKVPPLSRPWSPSRQQDLPEPGDFENSVESGAGRSGAAASHGLGEDSRNIDVYSTSLPMRMDYEACMAYLLLPPFGGAMLLVFEHKSDYVRFHAWQSSLVFTFLFLIHLIFSFSTFISCTLLVFDLALIAYLTLHAYQDAGTLDRCEIPFFGRLASGFVDEE